MRRLIDADPIVYACGFAVEVVDYYVNWYEVVSDDPWDDTQRVYGPFRGAWRRDAFCEHMNFPKEVREDMKDVIAEPISNCLQVVKQQINNIDRATLAFIAENEDMRGQEHPMELYLTDGKSNFRNEVATIKGYKANRDPSHKPVWYDEIREYLVDHWGARIMYGYEADDAVAMAQLQSGDIFDTVICTIDKDLRMVPGLHYNYQKKEDAIVEREEGEDFFYMQLLMGDSTDNIGGCYRVGKVAATKVITNALKGFRGGRAERSQRLYDAVLGQYEASIAKHGENTNYAEMGAEAALLENARLLWMQEYMGQLWTPPGQPDERLPGYEQD